MLLLAFMVTAATKYAAKPAATATELPVTAVDMAMASRFDTCRLAGAVNCTTTLFEPAGASRIGPEYIALMSTCTGLPVLFGRSLYATAGKTTDVCKPA